MMISFFLIIWDLSFITHSWIKKPASDVRLKVKGSRPCKQ